MGKNFDLFITHKNLFPEELRRYLVQARLFEFDLFPTETLDENHHEEIQDLAFNFCLPFHVVAVEDNTSCVILWDHQKNSVGIEHTRGMMEIADTKNYLDEKSFSLSPQDELRGRTVEDNDRARENLQRIAEKYGGYPIMIRWGQGQLDWLPTVKKWTGKGFIQGAQYWFPGVSSSFDILENGRGDKQMEEALDLDFMRGMITAYEELLRMSIRTQFIKETRPKKQSKNKYKKTSERPVYTVVRPDTARKQMGLPTTKDRKKGSLKERRAHVRREHERTLRSEVFKNKQGQTVQVKRAYIPAIWEGPSESEDKNHFYRVILDLPKGIRDSCQEKR